MPSPLSYLPFWHRDWLASSGTRRLSPAARGVYIDLLAHQWEDGYIPENRSVLFRLCGLTEKEFENIWEELSGNFVSNGIPGQLINERLAKEREKALAKVQKNQDNGKKGGRPITQILTEEKPKGKPNENRTVSSGLTQTKPKQKPFQNTEYRDISPPLKGDSPPLNGLSPPNPAPKGVSTKGRDKPDSRVQAVLEHLNVKAKKRFQVGGAQAGYVSARLKDGWTVEDLKLVIDHRVDLWLEDDKMREYLRPQTLFCPKHWETYLPEAQEWASRGSSERSKNNAESAKPIEVRLMPDPWEKKIEAPKTKSGERLLEAVLETGDELHRNGEIKLGSSKHDEASKKRQIEALRGEVVKQQGVPENGQ